MSREQKQNIFIGDTFTALLECRQPDLDDPRNNKGLPATPVIATAKIRNKFDEVFLPIGGPGVFEDTVPITPQTGNTTNDRGAFLKYTVDTAFTTTTGDYVLFITAEYLDGEVVTEDIRYKIIESN